MTYIFGAQKRQAFLDHFSFSPGIVSSKAMKMPGQITARVEGKRKTQRPESRNVYRLIGQRRYTSMHSSVGRKPQ